MRSAAPRERIEDPLPPSYFAAFDQLSRDPNITLVVAEDEAGRRDRLPAALHPAGAEFAGRLARPDRGRPRRLALRGHGIGEQLVQWAVAEARSRGCKLVELLTHHTRVDAQRFYERLGFARSHVGMTMRF